MAPQESRFLGREVKDSDDVLWSVVVLGEFMPVVSLSGGTRRERCCLNIEQPSWESGPQAPTAVRGGDEVKEQVCSWQQGLELKEKSSWSVFYTESLLQGVLSRAGCSPWCDREDAEWGCRALAGPGWACKETPLLGRLFWGSGVLDLS